MNVLLVSTYELGHQPLGVAGPAAALRTRGHAVDALDLSVDAWDGARAAAADAVLFSVPMHTAARLARDTIATLPAGTRVACFGLYAAMCDDVADALVSRDPVRAVVEWVERRESDEVTVEVPARDLLPPLERYAQLEVGGERRLVATVAASEGCAHRCRHCPIPVVFDGRTRITPVDAVLADVEQQVRMGATHVTFADPDFLNGPHHARRVVDAFAGAFPGVSWDCTVKVEHILRHREVWGEFARAGLLFVVSAFESTNDAILRELDKGHTAADAADAVAVLRAAGIAVRPSWLPFTPWSAHHDVDDIVEFVARHHLVGNVDPVQYTIRLLVPEGSLLLGRIPDLGPWDAERLGYVWSSPLDGLQARLASLVERAEAEAVPPVETYGRIRAALGLAPVDLHRVQAAPRLTEPWYCCAEPTEAQRRAVV